MSSKWIDFAELKREVSIVALLERYGHLRELKEKGNGQLVGPCPIHGGKSPTAFNVSKDKNIFNCFSQCGGGNVVDYVMKVEDCDARAAGEKIAKLFNLSFEREGRGKKTAKVSEKKASGPPAESTKSAEVNTPLERPLTGLDQEHGYLFERGLTVESIKTFGVGYCKRGIMRGRVVIPIRNEDGELVAYAGRALTAQQAEKDGKYKLPRGFEKSRVVYNLDRAREHAGNGLVLVEGFFDVFRLHQVGIENVVALMGSSLSEHQETLLLAATDRVALMLDNDEAGLACRRDIWKRLHSRIYLKSVVLPKEGQQPDDLSEDVITELLG